MSDALFSGWGIRTMASGEDAYNPIGYHVGTVWPHDNSIIALGLAALRLPRRGGAHLARDAGGGGAVQRPACRRRSAATTARATHFPVEYPTACSPQAWATGAPLLLIRTLLGLDSDGVHLIVDPAIPDPLGRIELLDVPGAGAGWTLSAAPAPR